MVELTEVEVQNMVVKAAEEVEKRLVLTLAKTIDSLNTKVEVTATASAELQDKARAAFAALPAQIQESVESQLKANISGIVDLVGQRLEEKVKAMGGGGEGGTGNLIQTVLANSQKFIDLWNAYKQPTNEQAIMANMDRIWSWHRLLSKLEKGGGSGEDVTKAIADTFAQRAS